MEGRGERLVWRLHVIHNLRRNFIIYIVEVEGQLGFWMSGGF
jgi:hypothetical protein